MLNPIFSDALVWERNLNYNEKKVEKPFEIPFPINYGMGSDEVKKFVDHKVNNALKHSNLFKASNKPIMKSASKNNPSIRSMIFNQKSVVLRSIDNNLSVRCTSEEESKHKRGPKCMTCPMMSNKNTCTVNGITYNECAGGNCKSYNLIYIFKCSLCILAYIGKTTQPLHLRVNGHRASKLVKMQDFDISTLTDENILSYHCLKDHNNSLDFNKLYNITILKCVQPLKLLETEQYFINKFRTERPTGLNIENPMGLPVLRTQVNFRGNII